MRAISFRRRDLLSLILFAALCFVYFGLQTPHHPSYRLHEAIVEGPNGPANSTLGFGAIVAVSRDGSRRREDLLSAANLTGLAINIPNQPVWTEQDIETIKCRNQSRILRASALAWLGHLHALKWFLHSTTHSTALILEDDVDWDIHLRSHQIPLISYGLRELINFTEHADITNAPYAGKPSSSQSRNAATHPSPPTYWSDLDQWDILHLGHCGDTFTASQMSAMTYARFTDISLPQQDRLHPQTEAMFHNLGIHNQERLVHPSKRPLCSFGYAVTRASATRILKELHREEEDHGTWAYDVRLMEACRDLDWRCYSSSPEVFHHIDGIGSEIQRANGGAPLFRDGELEPWKKFQPGRTPHLPSNRDDEVKVLLQQDSERKMSDESKRNAPHTPNIACSARSHADAVSADERLLESVRAMAETPGECLVNQDKEDLRKNPSQPFVF